MIHRLDVNRPGTTECRRKTANKEKAKRRSMRHSAEFSCLLRRDVEQLRANLSVHGGVFKWLISR